MSVICYAVVPSFYATLEQRDDPALRGRAVIVGGHPGKRGLVQSATQEALDAGVREGMPMLDALALCPQARAVRTHMKQYRKASEQLRLCLARRDVLLESAELGAFYFLAPGSAGDPASPPSEEEALEEAREHRDRVRQELNLPLRVGLAPAKFLAKLAAEEARESGIRWIAPGEEGRFLRRLPVSRLPEVGPKTAHKLESLLRIRSVGDLFRESPAQLTQAFGNHGLRILEYAHGRDDSPVRGRSFPNSFGCEQTFDEAQLERDPLCECLAQQARTLSERLQAQDLRAARVGLKVRFANSGRESRSKTLSRGVAAAERIYQTAARLLERTQAGTRPVRGLGLSVSKLSLEGASERQLELFPDAD